VALSNYPTDVYGGRYNFRVGDIRSLPEFHRHQFDYAVCRSMKRMVIDNAGRQEWNRIKRELLRVAKYLIVIEYEDLPRYSVESEMYEPGQIKEVLPYIRPLGIDWFILAGPGDGSEAQDLHVEMPGVKIVGFEPNLGLRQFQRDHGFPGPIYPIALWDSTGTMPMWPGDDSQEDDDQNERCSSVARRTSAASYEVETRTLDELSSRYGPFKRAFLWADIEGAELRCLRGAMGLLQSGRILGVNVEASSTEETEITKFLALYGLELRGRWNCNTSGDRNWSNVVYTR
jgi:FkbM family methyltransferase